MFNKMYDIITFGSASRDIYLKSAAFKVLKDPSASSGQAPKIFVTGQGICLPFGSKIDVEDVIFTSGGGGTNTAATFAKQGFKTAFVGAVGNDVAGKEIFNELRALKIDLRFVLIKKEKKTNHSIIFLTNDQDRTILVYRGASELMSKEDISFNKLKARWFCLAPLAGQLCGIFSDLVNFAKENKIKVAVNPSKQQLSLSAEEMKNILKNVDILFLNQEEASILTGIDYENETEIFKKIDELCPGIAVMTKGGEGVVASDGKYLYSALPDPNRKIIDTTGAGDSFAAGFLSDYIRYNNDIEKAIQLGLANSAENLSEIGAKAGLLGKNTKFNRVPVSKQECGQNNLCITK